MYPITSAVKALYDAEQRQVLRITGTDKNGASISITDANVVIGGFNIDRFSCNGEKLEVGTAIAAEMTLKLDNHNGTFNGIVFEGTELFVEVGIADWTQDNPTVNWMPCGYFTPDQQPRTANQITIHALDRMVGFDITVDDTALTLPTTVAGLVGQVCTLCGVTLADDISAYTNASVAITALPTVQNMTYRNLIQWCAGVMATNAWFDWNGELRFSWYDNTTGYGMTTANRFASDYYEDDLTITGAAYTNSSGVEIVEGTDDYTIDLTGNALVGTLVATVLPAINTKVNGFTYRPLTASVINAPYLWPMDVVGFTDKNGNTYSSALTNVAYGLNGTTALESKGMTYAINAKAKPSGVTKEQAQLITEAMERVETDIDESLTQQDIFNRLTDNGAAQGMYLVNGQLYVNASYINAGYLSANRIQGGTLTLGGANDVSGVMLVKNADNIGVLRIDKKGLTMLNPDNSNRLYLRDTSLGFERPNPDGSTTLTGEFFYVRTIKNPEDYSGPFSPNRDSVNIIAFAELGFEGIVHLQAQPNHFYVSSKHGIIADLFTGQSFQVLGDFSVDGSITASIPLGIASGGTGASTAAGALANLGALPLSGGTMTGNIDMGQAGASSAAKVIQWTTTDGTVFQIRPYNNLFQIVRTPAGGTSSGVLNIDSDGNITVASPVSWRTALGVYGKSDVDGLVGAKIYSVHGTIVESGTTGTAKGYGKATVQIIGKTVLVDFSAKITTAGTVSNVYNIGISVATLRGINASIPAFTVRNGGNITFFDADGKYSSMNGYAGEASVNTSTNRWSFARVYNTSGSVGAWPDSDYQTGMVITGTLQGVLD